MGPPRPHETGHFYFAQTGHSHFAATCEGKFVVWRALGGYDARVLDLNWKCRMKFAPGCLVFASQLCVAGTGPLLAQTSPLLPSQKAPLSNRVVAYQIEAKYNPKNHSLDTRETLTWTNYTGVPQDRLPSHLS